MQEGTLEEFDSLRYKGYSMYYKGKAFLRPQVLVAVSYTHLDYTRTSGDRSETAVAAYLA